MTLLSNIHHKDPEADPWSIGHALNLLLMYIPHNAHNAGPKLLSLIELFKMNMSDNVVLLIMQNVFK